MPSLADLMWPAAGARYALRSVGGDHVRDVSFAGTLIALALTAPALRLTAALVAVPIHLSRTALAVVKRAWRAL
jgi:hypothetical protein